MRAMAGDQEAVDRHFRLGHVVVPEVYATALDLWRALDSVQERWTRRTARECEWMFRGHADARWSLVPSAWRTAGPAADLLSRAREKCVRARGDVPDVWELQTLAEQFLLREFISVADREGLELPPDTPRAGGAPQRSHEVVTLAQHHGLPTGLLDFTRDPATALFWAMHTDEPREDGDLAVWAIFRLGWGPGVEAHSHAKVRNRNLLAQDGVTVEMTMADHFLRAVGRLPSLEECAGIPIDGIVKLTLKRTEAPELRRLLEVRGLTLARLVPGLQSVARTALARLY